MVLKDRKLVGVALPKMAADAANAQERLRSHNASNKALYDSLESIVGSFCPGLAKQPFHIHRYGAPL